MYSEEDVDNLGFADSIAEDVCQHAQFQIEMEERPKAVTRDKTLFDAATMIFFVRSPVIAVGVVAAGAMGGNRCSIFGSVRFCCLI